MTKNRSKTDKRRNRKGVAVIEIMVGMIIFAIGLLGAAGMTVAAARRATGLSTQSGRDGVVLQELNKLASVHYDSLAARVGCSLGNAGGMAYSRCITVTDVADGNGYKRVRLVVKPTTTWSKADTVYLNRAKGPIAMNPFGS